MLLWQAARLTPVVQSRSSSGVIGPAARQPTTRTSILALQPRRGSRARVTIGQKANARGARDPLDGGNERLHGLTGIMHWRR